MKLDNWMFLTQEEIDGLEDGQYYWIAYEFPNDKDETWAIGKYDKKFGFFNLCERISISPDYVLEAQRVEPAH